MIGQLVMLGFGIGLRYTIKHADVINIEKHGITRTQYFTKLGQYVIGWKLDNHKEKFDYELNLKIYRDEKHSILNMFWR